MSDNTKICPGCLCEFSNKGFGSYCNRSCHGKCMRSRRKDNRHHKYNDPEYKKKNLEQILSMNTKRFGNIVKEDIQCACCPKKFTIQYRSNCQKPTKKTCSRKCAANLSNKNVGIKLKKLIENDPNWGFKNPKFRAKVCNKNIRSSSKGERTIRQALKNIDISWKAHRSFNGRAVDISNPSLKIVVEYDGPTHFREIFGTFEKQKQKDQNLMKWIKETDWKLYRISDHYFTQIFRKDVKLVVEDIYNFINSRENILLRYSGLEETY